MTDRLAFTSHVGEFPLFFYVTDADVSDVEAVMIDEHGTRHDMIEFEETPPDEQGRWGRRVGARVPVPFWAAGAYQIEWTIDGVTDVYDVTVLPHRTHIVDGKVALKMNIDEARRFHQLPAADQRAVTAELLKGL